MLGRKRGSAFLQVARQTASQPDGETCPYRSHDVHRMRYTHGVNWDVEYTDEFEEWWDTLTSDEQASIDRAVAALIESGHKPFKTLSDKLHSTPEGRAALERQGAIMRDMLALHKLREAHGAPQGELTKAWDTSQTTMSRVEYERDMYLSTLRTYIKALGGHLELRAVFPDQTITLDEFSTAPTDVTSPSGQQIA